VGIIRIDNRLFRLLAGGSKVDWRPALAGIAIGGVPLVALWWLPVRALVSAVDVALLAGAIAAFGLAFRLTHDALNSAHYQTLRLAALPPAEIGQGFWLAALYRTRFLLGLLLGLTITRLAAPYIFRRTAAQWACFAFVHRANWVEVVRQFGFSRMYRLPESPICLRPADLRLLADALVHAPLTLALPGLMALMMAIGVALALALHAESARPFFSVLLAGTALAVIAAGSAAPLLDPNTLPIPTLCQPGCTTIMPWPPALPLVGIGLLVAYPLIGEVLRLARRWV